MDPGKRDTPQPTSLASRVNAVCDRFEAAWRAGATPRLEEYLDEVDEADRPQLLRRLLDVEIAHSGRRGEPMLPEDYRQRFPFYGDVVAAAFASSTLSGDGPSVVGGATASEPARATDWPSIPGYEILGTLGRGGMGVVYKARQVRLKRVVALKMLRSGQFSDTAEVARFRLEAEVVARFEHPHLLHIYDIGEAGGQPFLALEFCPGGSLDKQVRGTPLEPAEAARLVASLARAMQAAHERGIVHRDLKPANVLLAADGRPKIADFGLAKCLDVGDGTMTQSGAVMGTPAYMAPEQAAGQTRAIGPATDVYALGAILYECLTGRPPFSGSNTMEILDQVRHAEPAPPSRSQPRVPRDLETICLKCLAKEPEGRYSSALALAHDLELFIAGEPIRARRIGPAASLWRKVRRRPLLAVSLLLLLLVGAIALTVGPRAYRDRRIAIAAAEIEDHLQAPELTEAYLQRGEALIGTLESDVPEKAAPARRRLHQRYADRVRDGFRDRLTDEEATPLRAAIAPLAALNTELADALTRELALRLGQWQHVLHLEPPFDNADRVFLGVERRIERCADLRCLRRTAEAGNDPYVFTQDTFTGNIKIEAVFEPGWEKAAQIGLMLGSDQTNYSLLLTVPESFRALGEAVPLAPLRATFADSAKNGKPVSMAIFRSLPDGSEVGWLARRSVSIAKVMKDGPADGTLRLELRREGDRLFFQVNQRVLDFREAFFVPATEAVRAALYWPAPAALRSLRVERRAGPSAPSELENGDRAYQHKEFALARDWYEKAKLKSNSEAVRQEARYKDGLCLWSLRQEDGAIAAFKTLGAEAGADADVATGPCWPLLAQCQLLRVYHRRGEAFRTQADEVLDKILLDRRSRRPGELAAVIPADECESLIDARRVLGTRAVLRKPDDLVADAERVNKLATLFEADDGARLSLQVELAKIYHLAGRETDALRTSYRLLAEFKDVIANDASWATWAWDHHCWLLRRKDSARLAETELNQWLFHYTGSLRSDPQGVVYFPLVERARINVALKKWDAAEADLELFFKMQTQAPPPRRSYGFHAAACLAQGFLRERRGDKAGAQAAWRRGLIQSWGRENPNDAEATISTLPLNIDLVHHFIMAALTGELTKVDADDLMTRLQGASANQTIATVAKGLAVPPEVFQQMWLSERGRRWAERMAYRDLSYAEYATTPALLTAAEYMRQRLVVGPLAPGQDEVFWELAGGIHGAYLDGTIGTMDLGLLYMMGWKGTIGAPNVDSTLLKKKFVRMRGPLAYVLGLHALRQPQAPQRAEAAGYFAIARDAAAKDDRLRRLAEAELDRLKTGKSNDPGAR
jgi:hypothetical protein